MKAGAENRKKTRAAVGLGAVAVLCMGYAYYQLFGGSSTPPPSSAPHPQTAAAPAAAKTFASTATRSAVGSPASAGVPAAKMASSAAGLDPTLNEAAMLRTESLTYTGTGRNIFSLNAVVELPADVPAARPKIAAKAVVPVVLPPAPPPTCPPTCPPINLKFFGTQKDADGQMHAFFLSNDDVYYAREGEIVAHKYKIGTIGNNTVRVEDLPNHNTQSLPLQH